MRISYCQNIKRSAPTLLKVPCLFHTGFGLGFLVFLLVPSAQRLLFGSCTDVFLSAKAEEPVKTRQVFDPMLPGW